MENRWFGLGDRGRYAAQIKHQTMILESAFYKLPELLETSAARQQVREATVVHAMATAVLMELNARNIQHPTQHVVVEKRFDRMALRRTTRRTFTVN